MDELRYKNVGGSELLCLLEAMLRLDVRITAEPLVDLFEVGTSWKSPENSECQGQYYPMELHLLRMCRASLVIPPDQNLGAGEGQTSFSG